MNIFGIIFCRLDSIRLKEKALLKVGQFKLIERVIIQAKKITGLDNIILATSINIKNDKLVDIAKKKKISIFRGSEKNVLRRIIECIKKYKIDYFVRICGDRPFFDFKEISKVLAKHKEKLIKFDFFTNMITKNTGVDPGLTIEIISTSALKKIFNNKKEKKISMEHITKSFYKNEKKFKIYKLKSPKYYYNGFRYVVDNKKDLERTRFICTRLNNSTNIKKIVSETKKWYEK